MSRELFHELAAQGHRVPIGTDLLLREKPDSEDILRDGIRLGQVVAESARFYNSPLAIPLMDLTVEKEVLFSILGIPEDQIPTYHLDRPLSMESHDLVEEKMKDLPNARMRASVEAVRYVVQKTDLFPMGMVIGPFSLMTKLLSDPITPVYLSGTGVSGEEDESVLLVEQALDLSMLIIEAYLKAQIEAGAKAILVAEPAANKVYISPNLLEKGSDIFDRMVLQYHHRMIGLMRDAKVELFFHCCGELVPDMVRAFTTLDPAVLSLGSSRKLWEDAALVPKETVLYGNLPSKFFYSDEITPIEKVKALSHELICRMEEVGHPFILGSECDVLSVEGNEERIRAKVQAFLKD